MVDLPKLSRTEDFTMAEINKLSVGKVLDKLRSTDVPKSKITRLEEKTESLDQEIQRLRAARRRLERDQRAGSTERD
jgi:cell division protein FtsB